MCHSPWGNVSSLELELEQRRLLGLSPGCLCLLPSPRLGTLPLLSALRSLAMEPVLEPVELSHLVIGQRVYSDVLRHVSPIQPAMSDVGHVQVDLSPVAVYWLSQGSRVEIGAGLGILQCTDGPPMLPRARA